MFNNIKLFLTPFLPVDKFQSSDEFLPPTPIKIKKRDVLREERGCS